MNAVLWLSFFTLAFWYWSDTSKAREIAIRHGKKACDDMNLQFLDGTAVRFRTVPKRGPDGHMCWARDFSFEFTTDGIRRYPGHVRLLGSRLQMLDIHYSDSEEKPDSNLIMTASYASEKETTNTVILFRQPKK